MNILAWIFCMVTVLTCGAALAEAATVQTTIVTQVVIWVVLGVMSAGGAGGAGDVSCEEVCAALEKDRGSALAQATSAAGNREDGRGIRRSGCRAV